MSQLNIDLKLNGDIAFFIKMLMSENNLSIDKIMADSLTLYYQTYINKDLELAFIKGDMPIKKLNTADLWRNQTHD